MATKTVNIAEDGTPTPAQIVVIAGDIVAFHAEADAVVCVDPGAVFGSERFEIPANSSLDLHVQTSPPSGFQYITKMGDLGAACSDGRDKSGGGSGGPG